MNKLVGFSAALAISAAAASPALAQEVTDGWRVSVTPYLWVSGYEGDASGFPTGHPRDITVEFPDLLEHLSGAFIGKGEIQYRRAGVFADALYIKLSGDRTIDPAHLPELGSEVEIALTTATLAAFYRVHESDRLNLDLLAGARFTKAEFEVDLSAAAGPGVSRGVSRSWTDPIVGVRATQRVGERSSLTGYGDYGGFGVNNSTVWQLYGAYNYQWTDHTTVSAGYRMMSTDLKKNDLSYEVILAGPLVGLTYRF